MVMTEARVAIAIGTTMSKIIVTTLALQIRNSGNEVIGLCIWSCPVVNCAVPAAVC